MGSEGADLPAAPFPAEPGRSAAGLRASFALREECYDAREKNGSAFQDILTAAYGIIHACPAAYRQVRARFRKARSQACRRIPCRSGLESLRFFPFLFPLIHCNNP
jgi:hypothetical protein